MTPNEIKDLVETLRACGVTHYKNGELELNLGPAPVVKEIEDKDPTKLEQLKTQFFDDNYILDRLFPLDSTNGGTEESVAGE